MKILNLIQCANLGGMEQASLRLMRGLQARGHALELLSLNPVGDLGPKLAEAGIKFDGLPYAGRGGWRILGSLRKKLQASEAEALIMTGHHLLGMLALGNFARDRRILTIHFHHGGVKPDWEWRLIYRIACKKFKAITFPADFIRQEAEQLYPPVAKIAHTIRYPLTVPALPTSEQKLAARRALNLPLNVPLVGNAGWLIPRKRFDVFLETAAKISKRFPDAHFVIAGDGPERTRLEALAEDLKLKGKVTWTGWIGQMEQFHQSLDVLLFNSDWDAMGLTPLEAAAQGVPVVASVVNGGLKEIISSPEWGILLDRHDPEQLAEAAGRLLENPEAARKLGQAGREHIREVSDPAKIAAAHEQLLMGKSL